MDINIAVVLAGPPGVVLDCLTSESYISAVVAGEDRLRDAQALPSEATGTYRVRWSAPTHLPGFLSKYANRAPEEVSWVETLVVAPDGLRAAVTIEPDIPPSWQSRYVAQGEIRLTPIDKDETRLEQSFVFRLNVPLLGRLIEKAVEVQVGQLLEHRLEVLAREVAEAHPG